MAITAETRTDIIELVVTSLDAAPGTALLTELTAIIEGGGTLADVAANLTASANFSSLYPSFLTAEEFANEWLGNLVPEASAEALAEGVAIAVGLLNGGASRADLMLEAQSFLSAASETDADFGTSAARFNNKVEVATYHTVTNELDASSLGLLQEVVGTVTSDDTTVTSANAVVDGTAAVNGQTYALTTGVDSIVGTTGNDVFNAVNGSTNTLTAPDSINGGSGTDTLNLLLDANGSALAPATITSIENFFFRELGDDTTIDTNLLTGEQQLWSDRSDHAITFNNVASGTTIGMKGNSTTTNGNITANHGLTVTSGTLAIDGDTTAGTVTFTGASMSSMTINSTGGTNKLTALVAPATTKSLTINATTGLDLGTGTTNLAANSTITVTGAGAVDLGSNVQQAAVDTIDASGNSGGVTVHLDDEVTDKFTGSSGNDTVTAGGTAFVTANTGFIKGGEGTDTLIVDNNNIISTAASGAKISEFETVRLDDPTLTIDMDNLAATNTITALQIDADGNAAPTINNLNSTIANAITLIDGGTGVLGNVTLNVKGAATPGQLDSITVTLSDSTPTELIDIDNLVVADVETINVVGASSGTSVISALTHQDWDAFNISGSGPLSITSAAVAANVNTNINGSAATGALTLNFAASTTNGMSITGGSGKDTITGTAQNDVINGGDEADTITGGVGLDTLTGGGGADTFSFANTATGLPNATTFDTITDFTKASDKIDGPVALTISQSATASTGTAAINAEGIASFAAADDTLAEKITAVAAGLEVATATTAGDFAVFEHGSDSYVFITDATGAVSATDVLIKLTGVTGLSDTTITSGDVTIT